MKRNYQKPAMRVVEFRHKYSILVGSNQRVSSVGGNVFNSGFESDEDYSGDIR